MEKYNALHIDEANKDHQYLKLDDLLNNVLNFKGRDLLLLDTETTGVKGERDQLTQIAAAIVNGESLTVKKEFNEKVQLLPGIQNSLFDKMSPEMIARSEKEKAKKNLGLKDILQMTNYFDLSKQEKGEMSKSKDKGQYLKGKYQEAAPKNTEKEVIESFLNFIRSSNKPIIVAHNLDFDVSFLKERMKLYGLKETELGSPSNQLDTLDLVKHYFVPALQSLMKTPNENVKKIAMKILTKITKISNREYKKKGTIRFSSTASLGPQSQALQIDAKGWHDAFADIMMMLDVMKKVIKFLKDNKDTIENESDFYDRKDDMKTRGKFDMGVIKKIDYPIDR